MTLKLILDRISKNPHFPLAIFLIKNHLIDLIVGIFFIIGHHYLKKKNSLKQPGIGVRSGINAIPIDQRKERYHDNMCWLRSYQRIKLGTSILLAMIIQQGSFSIFFYGFSSTPQQRIKFRKSYSLILKLFLLCSLTIITVTPVIAYWAYKSLDQTKLDVPMDKKLFGIVVVAEPDQDPD